MYLCEKYYKPTTGQYYIVSCFSWCVVSYVQPFVTPWTIARQAPLSMEFSRQEFWSGLPFPPAGDLPDLGIEPESPVSLGLADGFFITNTTREARVSWVPRLTLLDLMNKLDLLTFSWNRTPSYFTLLIFPS